MTDNRLPELAGWKGIAARLQVDEKTARRYFKNEGLPVRKRGGRYFADPNEIDVWKRGRPRESPTRTATKVQAGNEPNAPSLVEPQAGDRRRLAIVWPVAVLLAFVLMMGLIVRGMRPNINAADLEGNDLVASSKDGREIWRVEFPGVDAASIEANPQPATLVRDVDDDGRMEVLFNYHPLPSEEESGRLICFESSGSLKWELSYRAELAIADRHFAPLYVGHHLRWLETATESFVLIVTRHVTWYPARLVLLDPSNGQVRSEYWHPGYIEALTLFDLDQDGTDELVIGGINNPGPGPGHPALAALDIPFRDANRASPNFFGLTNAKERAYLLFPRIDSHEAQHHLLVVNELQVQGPNRLRVTINAIDHGGLIYYLDRRLQVLDLQASDTLIHNHDHLFHLGVLDHRYNSAELDDWRTILSLGTAPDGNSPTVRSSFR